MNSPGMNRLSFTGEPVVRLRTEISQPGFQYVPVSLRVILVFRIISPGQGTLPEHKGLYSPGTREPYPYQDDYPTHS